MRQGYKVVYGRDSSEFSSSFFILPEVKYRYNKFTHRPKGWGPLCVFTTLKSAKHYRDQGTDLHHVIACEYVPSRAKSVWCRLKPGVPLSLLPAGTALANKVKLRRAMV
jgi:hypothetical protein